MVGKATPGRALGRALSRWKPLQPGERRGTVAILATLALFIAVVCLAGTKQPPLNDHAAWREACKVSGYSCFGVTPPFVAQGPIGPLLGRYRMGDKYILVNEDISGNLAYAVRVHEMTHYLQWKHGRWKFSKLNSCQMEHDAFDVSNAVLRRLGDTKSLVDWDKMRLVYGCSV